MNDAALKEIDVFLTSGEGNALIRRNLERFRLPAHFGDDLRQEVRIAAFQVLRRGEPIGSLGAFCNTAAKRRADDIADPFHQRRRFSAQTPSPEEGEPTVDPATLLPDTMSGIDGFISAAALGALRQAVCAHSAAVLHRPLQHWEVAACLTYLSVHTASLRAPEGRLGIRQPNGLSERGKVLGLWYAHRRECFPELDGKDTDSVRKTRERRKNQLQLVLQALPDIARGVFE